MQDGDELIQCEPATLGGGDDTPLTWPPYTSNPEGEALVLSEVKGCALRFTPGGSRLPEREIHMEFAAAPRVKIIFDGMLTDDELRQLRAWMKETYDF